MSASLSVLCYDFLDAAVAYVAAEKASKNAYQNFYKFCRTHHMPITPVPTRLIGSSLESNYRVNCEKEAARRYAKHIQCKDLFGVAREAMYNACFAIPTTSTSRCSNRCTAAEWEAKQMLIDPAAWFRDRAGLKPATKAVVTVAANDPWDDYYELYGKQA